jgi:Flp pilus assembly protein TadD
MIHFGTDVTPERREETRAAAFRAVELAPEEARSHIAMGFFQYHALKNYPEAERAFARAAELRPRDPELLRGLALVQRLHDPVSRRVGRTRLGAGQLAVRSM